MRTLSVKSLIQIVTTLSVLIGIVLVIYELRQTRDIAETDLRTQSLVLGMDLKSSLIGERGIKALGKACLDEDLAVQEIFVLDTYFRAVYDQINYLRLVSETFGSNWETYATEQFERVIFQTNHGRKWWEPARSWMHLEIRAIGEQAFANLEEATCYEDLELQYRI